MHRTISRQDCLDVATLKERSRLAQITDITLLKQLALRWCKSYGYKLGGYTGNDSWDVWYDN